MLEYEQDQTIGTQKPTRTTWYGPWGSRQERTLSVVRAIAASSLGVPEIMELRTDGDDRLNVTITFPDARAAMAYDRLSDYQAELAHGRFGDETIRLALLEEAKKLAATYNPDGTLIRS